MTEWRQIPGYQYSVSSGGDVKNDLTQYKFKPCGSGRDRKYQVVALRNEGGVKRFYVHRLVAEAFIPNPDAKSQVNHKDGNTLNNAASNLEWATGSENQLHRFHVLGKGMSPEHLKRIQDIARNFTSVKVRCVETGEVFKSQSEAAKHIGVQVCAINACIHKRSKTCGGFRWERVDMCD